MKKVIVTGATGFIGYSLIKKLIRKKVFVYAVIRNNFEIESEKEKFFSNNCSLIKLIELDLKDIKDLGKYINNNKIDVCYHLAWEGLKDKSILNYKLQLQNVVYCMELIRILSKFGCKKFIGAGSITQLEIVKGRYGNGRERYYRIAKDTCEKMGNELANDLQVEFIWPYITNTYGQGEVSNRFIITLISKLINDEEMELSECKQCYDFVYIDDLTEAYILLGEYGKANRNYIIGSGKAKPLKEWIKGVPELLGSEGKLKFGGIQYLGIFLDKKCFDITELQDDTGYVPRISFDEGILKTAKWKRNEKNE